MSMPTVTIETVTLTQTRTEGFCNTVNKHRRIGDEEYRKATQVTNYTRYMHLLDQFTHHVYDFTNDQRQTLVEAGRVSCITGQESRVHTEELQELVDCLQQWIASFQREWQPVFGCEAPPFFMRLDACSTKDATRGVARPVRTGADIVMQITRSEKAVYALDQRDSSCLILKQWRSDITFATEFRCFIYNHHLTAISQYSVYEAYGWERRRDDLTAIVAGARSEYQRVGQPFAECVMDVHVGTADGHIEIVEFNPFGWQLNSGPACFDWQCDDAILRSNGSNVYVRVVVE